MKALPKRQEKERALEALPKKILQKSILKVKRFLQEITLFPLKHKRGSQAPPFKILFL